MFGFSMGELILLGVIGLVVIGPKDLPVVARMIGRLLNELKRASGDLTNVLLEARDETQKSLLEARDEYNKVLSQASILEEPKKTSAQETEPTPTLTTGTGAPPSDKKDV